MVKVKSISDSELFVSVSKRNGLYNPAKPVPDTQDFGDLSSSRKRYKARMKFVLPEAFAPYIIAVFNTCPFCPMGKRLSFFPPYSVGLIVNDTLFLKGPIFRKLTSKIIFYI